MLANTGVTTSSKILLYATGGSSGAVGFARVFKNTSGNQSGGYLCNNSSFDAELIIMAFPTNPIIGKLVEVTLDGVKKSILKAETS